MLSETLRSVDVVVEIRDSRLPDASSHPRVSEFCAGAARVIVINKKDLVPSKGINIWKQNYNNHQKREEIQDLQKRNEAFQRMQNRDYDSSKKEVVLWANARHGDGIHPIKRAVMDAGSFVNVRR